jgi:L-2-hydroxycarboxylate dehydrogenase (NAD+)
MAEKSVRVPVNTIVDFMIHALTRMGVPREDAVIVADVLIASDLIGVRSHGVAHLMMYYERIKKGIQLPVTRWTIVNETPTTAVVDGGNGMGGVIGYHAMKMAIAKARQHGVGAIAVRNSSHYGIAGYYTRMAAAEGMVGMSFTNAHPLAAPTFGVQPMLGTNPIAFSAPTDEAFPFTFDGATSIVARGKVEVAARENKPIPAGWVICEDGTLATDTSTMLDDMNGGKAALLPLGGSGELLGGHKGYGLSAMVEIISAAFQDGAYLTLLQDTDNDGKPQFLRIGHFFLAIDVAHFVPVDSFKHTAGNIVRELRASRKAPGEPRIYTAGEKGHQNTQSACRDGVEITPGLQRELNLLCAELGITGYELGFQSHS